jgi:DNA-binding MarR family transcriptional regulator
MSETFCFCTKLRRTARIITALYDDALAPAGMTAAQFSLMRAISRINKPTISDIAEAIGLDRSTLGRNLRVLERAGFVTLGPGKDERTRIVEVSDDGQRRMAIAIPLWEAVQEKVGAQMDAKTRDQALELLGALDKLVE